MIVLIEGIDKAGKTTIVNRLKQIFPSAIFCKNSFKPEGADPYDIGRMTGIYLGIYQLAKQSKDQLIFLDRGHITEIVYGRIKRGYDSLQYFNWEHYEKELKKYMKVIHVSAPVSVIQDRFIKEKEEYLVADEINKILTEYDIYMNNTSLSSIRIFGNNDKESNIAEIIKFIGDGHQRD